MKYRQCQMKKKTLTGYSKTTSYLPDEFAREGKYLQLKDDYDRWDNGLLVTHASQHFTTAPPDYRKAIRGHKKMTGDSLPKRENNG